jgi:hypothetical protein
MYAARSAGSSISRAARKMVRSFMGTPWLAGWKVSYAPDDAMRETAATYAPVRRPSDRTGRIL